MEACLRPQVSWCFINDNPQVESERWWRNRKSEKYSQKNVKIVYNSLCVREFVCAYVCVCVGNISVLLCVDV